MTASDDRIIVTAAKKNPKTTISDRQPPQDRSEGTVSQSAFQRKLYEQS